MRIRLVAAFLWSCATLGAVAAHAADAAGGPPADAGGARHRRAETFAFVRAPSCREMDAGPEGGRQWEVRFSVTAACDATVAVLDGDGRIVRHLASGVLGANAPAPFRKDSLDQALLWDGRTDLGAVVGKPDTCRIRVSLGLKPVFEKTLFHHPCRVYAPTALVPAKEGVYVLDGGIFLFDHAGKYVRTVNPPPARHLKPERLERGDCFAWSAKSYEGPFQLTLDDRIIASPNLRYGGWMAKLEMGGAALCGGTLVAVTENPFALRLLRVGSDGSIPPEGMYRGFNMPGRGTGPSCLAASPDGRWLYLTTPAGGKTPRHAVYRLPAAPSAAATSAPPAEVSGTETPFIGAGTAGNDEKSLNSPAGLAVDERGRIYVADAGNGRISIFDAAGAPAGTIPVAEPRQVAVEPDGSALYVVSCSPGAPTFALRKLDAAGQVLAQREFQLPKRWRPLPAMCLGALDGKRTVWITGEQFNLQIWSAAGGKFELIRDFHQDLLAEYPGQTDVDGKVADYKGPMPISTGGKPIVDFDEPYLHLAIPLTDRPLGGYAQSGLGVRMHTDTGRLEPTRQPVSGFAFDGSPLVRQMRGSPRLGIHRIDRATGKPLPYEHTDLRNIGVNGRYSFAPMPDGGIVIHCGGDVDWKKDAQPFPGRLGKGAGWVMRYDGQGKLVTDDLLPGLPLVSGGIRADYGGNIYVVLPLSKAVDGRQIIGYSLLKFPPSGGRFVVNGKGVPQPLEQEPARPEDFRHKLTYEGDNGRGGPVGYGDKCWVDGMLWSYGGVVPPIFPTHCHCVKGFFDLDRFARAYLPESHRQSVAVVDSNGNFLLRLGQYCNPDDPLDRIPIANAQSVGVNDTHLYVNDAVNRRILKLRLDYERQVDIALAKPQP